MIAWKISRPTSSSVINLSLYGLPLQALEWTEGALERRWGPSGPPTSLITSRAGDQLLHSGLSLLVSSAHKLGRKRRNALKKLSVFVVNPFRARTVFVLAVTSVLSSAVLDANVEDPLAPAVTLSS